MALDEELGWPLEVRSVVLLRISEIDSLSRRFGRIGRFTSTVATPDLDQLWASVAEAERASRRGTELLAELGQLIVRDDVFSAAWVEDRRKVRELIEAHLTAVGLVKARLHEARSPPEKSGEGDAEQQSSIEAVA